MKWVDGIAILSLALSGGVLTIAGFRDASAGNHQESSIIVVDGAGRAALLDTLLPAGEVGLIVAPSASVSIPLEQMISDSTPSVQPERTSSGPASSTPSTSKSTPKSTPKSTSKTAQPASPAPCVNINTADEKQLVAIKGIGPVLAAAIVAHRAQNGVFRKKEDILKVKGIGPAKFAMIVDQICL